jgi:hypothetical protein
MVAALLVLVVAVFAAGACTGKPSLSTTACVLEQPIDPGPLGVNRLAYVLFDLSRSTAKYHRALKTAVQEDVLDQTGPGDWAFAFRLGTSRGPYSEDNIVFASDRATPLVRQKLAEGAITDQRLARGCADTAGVQNELAKSWLAFDGAREGWTRALTEARAQTGGCCSAYVESLRYLGERFAAAPRARARWLFVLGDFEEQPALRGASLADRAQDLARERGPLFQNVKVRLIRPAGTSAPDRVHGWQSFFETLGASDVRTFYLGETQTAALDPSRVPLRPEQARRTAAQF